MKHLFLITARGGSKGIPGKNIKKLNGIPLINYAIDLARQFTSDDNICLSTDDVKISKVAQKHGLQVPFVRPKKLAGDHAGSYEVILHALNWYKTKGCYYDTVVLLQPTSPFRLKKNVSEALAKFKSNVDMVVSVNKLQSNPFATLYKKNANANLQKVFVKKNGGSRRQDAEGIYELNGAVYVFNVKSLYKSNISKFKKIKMVEMDAIHSVDIDEPLDWKWCEFLVKEKLVKLDFKIKE